jgi:hypothetical protein
MLHTRLTTLAVLLAACGTTEAPVDATDTGADAAADTRSDATEDSRSDGGDVSADTAEDEVDTPEDAPEDTLTDAADAADTGEPCIDGETTTEGCETCWCTEGEWTCSIDEWCAYEECRAECPSSCLPADEQPCGSSLEYFCTECHRECAGVEEVDRGSCEDPTSTCPALPPDAIPIEYTMWTPPEGCWLDEFGDYPSALISSEDSYRETLRCEGESGIDWDTSRLAVAVFYERPGAEVYAVSTRDSELVVQMAGRVYCGGPAPSNTSALVLVDSLPETLNVVECSYGACTGPPAP